MLATATTQQALSSSPLSLSSSAAAAEKWVLPAGAEHIIRQIAAEHVLHELLDQCCNTSSAAKAGGSGEGSATTSIEFGAIANIAREFPGTCGKWYEFRIDTRDEANRLRQLLPLHILSCLNPPLWAVEAVHQAHPDAIAVQDAAKGGTPLLYACSFEASAQVVQYLVRQHPAAVRIPRLDGATPLAMACSYQASPAVVDLLLAEYPEGIKRCSADGWYPIHAAVACQAPVQAVERLYHAFPESVTNVENATSSTALHLACSKMAPHDVVAFLLSVAPDTVRWQDGKRMTPWLWAVYTQSVSVVQLFVERIPAQDLPAASPEGISLLHYAARHNDAEVVEFLARRHPAQVVAQTRQQGMTPLHTACRRNRPLSVIAALVQANPTCLTLRNQRHRLPVDEAREQQQVSRTAPNNTRENNDYDQVVEFLVQEHQKHLLQTKHHQQATGLRGWWW